MQILPCYKFVGSRFILYTGEWIFKIFFFYILRFCKANRNVGFHLLILTNVLMNSIISQAQRWVPPLNTQCLQQSVESGELYVWDTALYISSVVLRHFVSHAPLNFWDIAHWLTELKPTFCTYRPQEMNILINLSVNLTHPKD